MAGSTAPKHPSAFVVYSWDDEPHKKWVRDFAERLRAEGVEATIDKWIIVPGDPLPHKMEVAVRENDFVLIVCTPNYKERSEGRKGGVGYEGNLITAEILGKQKHRKFIPILRSGDFDTAIPSWLAGKATINLRGDPYSEEEYSELWATLHGSREIPPPVGNPMIVRQQATAVVLRAKDKKPSKPKTASKPKGTFIMIGDFFLSASSVRHTGDTIELKTQTINGEEVSVLNELRSDRSRGKSLAFAANNEACTVRVKKVESEINGGIQLWTVLLDAEQQNGSSVFNDITHRIDGKTYIPEDMARMRIGRTLLNDPPVRQRELGYFGVDIEMYVEGSGKYPFKECVIRDVYAKHGQNPRWKEMARLKALFLLICGETVQHVYELKIGNMKNGSLPVKFRGQRLGQYTNTPPTTIEVSGLCPLS